MFDDLHDPEPPAPGLDTLATVSQRAQSMRRRRVAMISGGALAIVGLIAAVIVIPRLGDGPDRIVTVDTVDTVPSTPAPTTPASSTQPSTDTTVPTSTVPPSTACDTVPQAPIYLIDGSLPGDAVERPGSVTGETWWQWGSEEATQVTQRLSPSGPDGQLMTGELEVVGDVEVTVVPIGDPPLGEIVISIGDQADGCVRQYWVGPGLELDAVTAFARQWIEMLALDRQISVQEAPDELACTYASGELIACVGTSSDTAGAFIDGRLDRRGAVWVLLLAVAVDADVDPLSALGRRVALAGAPGVEIVVDLLPVPHSCGTLTTVGETVRWSIGDIRPSPCPDANPPTTTSSIVAIDGAGDAVVINDITSPPIVLTDGVDPDDPLPGEGDVAFIDGVALSDDGSTAVVGFCCEPGAGTLMAVDMATLERTSAGYGHLPATAGPNIVAASLGSINVSVDGSIAATMLDDPDGWVIDLALVPGDPGPVALALVVDPQGTRLWTGSAAGGDMFLETMLSTTEEISEPNFSLAGYAGQPNDGVYLVLDESTNTLLRFDAETLELVGSDLQPVEAVSMWIVNDAVRYVDAQRRLFVNDVQVPGEYLWVR